MIAFIHRWLTGITCAALAAVLAEELMPKGPVRQVGRLICGLMVLWATISPVLDARTSALPELEQVFREGMDSRQQELEQHSGSMLKTLIERETAAYIVDKAEQAGAVCRADVTCVPDENGLWVPQSVQVIGVLEPTQREQLSEQIAEELGIPPHMQSYTGGEQP